MDKWILAVNYDKRKFAEAQAEWLKDHIFIRMVSSMQKAINLLATDNSFLLIAIFSDQDDYISQLPLLRSMTRLPILIMKSEYDGAEKIAAIKAGADEYIAWSKSVIESVASGRALIRRYTELNQPDTKTLHVISMGEVFVSLDYRKVFVQGEEIRLPRREFDLFCLLVSHPNQVFKPEQLYREVWGEDYVPTENSLHSCIRRIRRKLEVIAKTSCQIHNERGVGYSFSQKNT